MSDGVCGRLWVGQTVGCDLIALPTRPMSVEAACSHDNSSTMHACQRTHLGGSEDLLDGLGNLNTDAITRDEGDKVAAVLVWCGQLGSGGQRAGILHSDTHA